MGDVGGVPGAESSTSSAGQGEIVVGDIGFVGEVRIGSIVNVELVLLVEVLQPRLCGIFVTWNALTWKLSLS